MSPQPQSREPTPPVRERTGPAVHASWVAGTLASRHVRGTGIALVAGVFLALTGAFETGSVPLLVRLLYWTIVMAAGSAVGIAISAVIDRTGWLEERPWVQGAVIVLALTPPLTVFVWLVTEVLLNGRLRPDRVDDYALPVVIITMALTALNYIIQRKPQETHAQPAGSGPPRFLDRLPAKLRGSELYAVEAEDHYLRLHTSKGQDLILMRLSDAVAELEGIEGARTHRSWWVAKGAVEGARRGDGRATLTLKGGAVAPVSRAYAGALRAAGWY